MRATLYDPNTQELLEGGVELVDAWEQTQDGLLWLMIEAKDPKSESVLLEQRFGIHRLAVNDAMRERHPPKIEEFDSCTFLLLKGLNASASTSLEFRTIQLAMFVGDRFLVTRSSAKSLSSEALMDDLSSGAVRPDVPRAALALLLCRKAIDRFLPILFTLEARLQEMEAELLGRPSDDLLGELVRQKGDLKQMLRILEFHTQIFAFARQHPPKQLSGHPHEEQDVKEQLERQLSLARLYFELSDDLMQGYLSLSAHRLNQIMQTLTIVTVIFVPITFMAGLYGMNFEFMPELGFKPGYFVLLSLMFVVVLCILGFFRWKGWLGGGMVSFQKPKSRPSDS